LRVHITRRGGLAGIPLSADVDTDNLEGETAARLEQALPQVVAAGGERAEPSHPDEFQYEISLPDSNQSARVRETDLPPDVRQLVNDLVMGRA
jgi:hypothetical protein